MARSVDAARPRAWSERLAMRFDGHDVLRGGGRFNAFLLSNCAEAQMLAAAWRNAYNHQHRHSNVGYQAPAKYAAGCAASTPAAPTLQQHSRSQDTSPIPQTVLS